MNFIIPKFESLDKNDNNSICLNMIVKDEAHVIKRTLENLCCYVNFAYWVICDTGSTDDTRKIIADFFKEKNIPGELHDVEWRDFGYNRTVALNKAYNKTDYLLIFDADDSINGKFILPMILTADKYNFFFGDNTHKYIRPLLINNRKKWKFNCILHEILANIDPIEKEETICGDYYITSGREGNRNKNPNKYLDDANLLEKEIALIQTSKLSDIDLISRYTFYCAQSFHCACIKDKAIMYYKKVLDLDTWAQEKYVAALTIGNIYKSQQNMEEALHYWYKAISYDRERRETVINIMEYFYNKGNHFAVNCLHDKIKDSKITDESSKLFLDISRYHDIDYYNSISACNVGEWMSGYYSCKKLLLNDKYVEITLHNFKCYGYNIHLDPDNREFLDKLLILFDKYFDSKRELIKELWNMVSKHIKEVLPVDPDETNVQFTISKDMLSILNNYKSSAWLGHIEFASWIVNLIKPKIIVDLGVDNGHSTYAFASNKIGHIYGIDCFKGDEHAGFRDTQQDVNNFKKELIDKKLLIDNITFIKGYFIDIYKTFDKEIDILHIDGLHHYENVKEDYETWVTKTHNNSIILFHDVISFPNTVGKFFDEIPYPKFYFTHCHGLGVVCKNYKLLKKLYNSPNIPYKENIIFKQKKNYCFIHSCNIKETGTETLNYLIDKINNSGLINNLDKIFINNIGIPIENIYGNKFEINNYSKDINLFELPTINMMHDFSEINRDCNILYLHTKGISHINNLLTQQNNIKNWVDMMLYFLVEKFELCIDKLNNNDAVGCNYYTTPEEAYHLACGGQVFLAFSGNFWWSKSNFIKTLPKLNISENINKYDAELWLCKNNPTVHILHNSHVNHYLQNYPRERYIIKKFNASQEYQFNKLDNKYNEIYKKSHKISLEEASNKILIYAGFHQFLWNDTLVDKENFCGGSQKAVAYLARYLPKNYEIFISGDVKNEVIDNITYINRFNLQPLLDKEKFHTIIISRYVSFFLLYQKFKCYQLYLTAQDFSYINMIGGSNILPKTIIENNNDVIDGAVCLTDFHKKNTEIIYPMLKDKLNTINNGINPQDFKFNCNQKIKNKFVWTSTAYRGLEILLDLWPKILEKLPDATLGISSYNSFPNNESEIKMKEIIDCNDSITYHGKLNTEELYKLTSTAEYWLYTNTFAETSCITGMEMLMNEVICLYYPVAGLVDTVGEYGIKVEKGNELETILNLSKERKDELKKNGKEYAISCSWENRAKEWIKLLGLYNSLYTVDNYNYQQSIKFITYPIDNCIISKIISTNQVWEPHMHRIFEKYINKESIVLEGGCHIGTHTLKLALLGKQLLAFEPLNKSRAILDDNLKINNIDNVTLYSEGLSNSSGLAYFEWSQINNPGGSGLSNNPMGTPMGTFYIMDGEINKYPVKLITIDSLQLNKLDFIKLDVEGYEINVIEGAINTIKRCKPIITLESWKNHFGEICLEHTKNTFKILLDNGYSIEYIGGPDFLFLPPVDNYLCIIMSLCDLDDKITDKNTSHSYLPLYETLLGPIRNTANNILEVGIGDFADKNGGSLLLWQKYFTKAIIYGIDILPENRILDELVNNKSIKLYTEVDAYDESFVLNKLQGKKFDCLIDDGPHTLDSQEKFIELYSPLLSENGILIIEDVQDINFLKNLKNKTPEYLKKYIKTYDLRNNKKRYDDIVFTIDKINIFLEL